jgi:hypothetical protein
MITAVPRTIPAINPPEKAFVDVFMVEAGGLPVPVDWTLLVVRSEP